MRLYLLILIVFCSIGKAGHAQEARSPALNIGDPAPPLRVHTWLKGTPVERFEKGHVYLVELWATWCAPCKAAIPHLSVLAQKYQNRVTIVGIDIAEKKTTPIGKIKAFVDSMGDRMAYTVATEDSNWVESNWLLALEGPRHGIPQTFVIDAEGRLAWTGRPDRVEAVLANMLNHTWDIEKALADRKVNNYLAELDDSLDYELARFRGTYGRPDDPGKPDSALIAIDAIIKKEPRLKYAPRIAYNTFAALLKTDPHKAYDYGREVMAAITYEDDPPYDVISGAVSWYSDKLHLPGEIYRLGAEAYQAEIDHFPYPGILDRVKLYNTMAEWYARAGEEVRAADAKRRAEEAGKK